MIKKISLLITVLISMLIIGCSPKTGSLDEIRISDGKGDWGLPTPYLHYPRGPGYVRMSWVFDTLVWKNAKGYIPGLADSWKYDKKSKSFTFKLNPKARWHDGKPVTAKDVCFTIEYFKKYPYRWINLKNVSKGKAVNSHEVKIILSKSYSPFLSDIAGTMPIIPEHIWKDIKKPHKFTDKRALTGCGPYRFIDFNKVKGTYLYEAVENYYRGKVRVKRLIYIKGNPLLNLSTGKGDFAQIKPQMIDKLKKSGMTIIKDKFGWNKKLMINHKKAPFNSKKFRHALVHAINRQEIIDKAHQGYGALASFGLLSKDHELYYPKTPDYEYNPQKSQALLESLGYKKGKGGYYHRNKKPLTIELLASTITIGGERAADRDGEIIRNNLEAIGIKTELITLQQAMIDSKVKQWDFDCAISGHGGILGDPKILSEMISPKYGAGSVNSARYDANDTLNKLLDEQFLAMDTMKRKAIVYKIQEIYGQDLPAISLYYPEAVSAFNPKKNIFWFYTMGGIAKGIPIAQNKMALVE